jgi:hypothetical protein
MSCGSKIWVPLIGVTGYISYTPVLMARQLGGMQYVSRTLGLIDFPSLFRHQSSLKDMEFIRQNWERLLLVKKEEGSGVESSFNLNYTMWRNKGYFRMIGNSE